MPDTDWLDMLAHQQALHRFSRSLLPQKQKRTLTASELELLSQLYLNENCTPLDLSRLTGMKKEAVSRSLKQLLEQGCVTRTKHPADERSYLLTLSPEGARKLEENYGPVLQPLYELRRRLGDDFAPLFALIAQANRAMNPEL